MKFKCLLLLIVAACLIPSNLFAWGGSGHNTVGVEVAKHLPSPWREKLQGNSELFSRFLGYNLYPDSFKPLEPELWGEDFINVFEINKMKNHYDFHHSASRCVGFQVLVEAIRRNDVEKVFLILGCLSHVIADQSACNHYPYIHYATYTLGSKGLNVSPELIADISWLDKQDFSHNIWEKRCAEINFTDTNPSVSEMFERLMFIEWEATNYFRYGSTIVEASEDYVNKKDAAAGEKLAASLSELGAWAVEHTVKIFNAALRLAASGETVVWSGNIEDYNPSYTEKINNFILNRPISNDSFCVQALPKGLQSDPVRVLYDPTGKWNNGLFKIDDRIIAVGIVNTLQKNSIDASIFDVREFNKFGIENPADIKLLIVPAQKVTDYFCMKRDELFSQLKKYQEVGGKVLWIGSMPSEIAPKISKNLTYCEQKDSYTNPAYPVSMDELLQSSVTLLNTTRTWKFKKKPRGDAGWTWPSGRLYFVDELDEDIIPVVALKTPDKTFNIGAVYPKIEPIFGFITTYSIYPYFHYK